MPLKLISKEEFDKKTKDWREYYEHSYDADSFIFKFSKFSLCAVRFHSSFILLKLNKKLYNDLERKLRKGIIFT